MVEIKIIMNTLKKALTKDDVKLYQQKHIQPGNMTKINQHIISNRNNWTDINQFIECVTHSFYSEKHLQKVYRSGIQLKSQVINKKIF